MNTAERLKQILTPSVVVQHYLGQPVKSNSLGMWYKSPFRSERTASFLVNDIKGIHDFGTSIHYDIISFVQELFKIDFVTAINKLSYDFGIIDCEQTSNEFRIYINQKREEEMLIKRNLDKWFKDTFGKLCDRLQEWQRLIPHLKGEALVIAYKSEGYLDYSTDVFLNAYLGLCTGLANMMTSLMMKFIG